MIKPLNKFLNICGVQLETEPEFVISKHATKRLKERLNISDKKIKKVVVKAWHSKQHLSKKFNKVKYKQHFHGKGRICREYMGYVFVFAYCSEGTPGQKKLITVI